MQKEVKNWYTSWFDTPYYHILYKDRDHKEAHQFMDVLTNYLNLPEQAKVLDLACGKGRHSIYLNQLGYDVIGADLSPSSIEYAKQFENDTLHFVEHDMCVPLGAQFDAIFNLFTSFGYFENEEDNLNALKAIKCDLSDDGFAVIDFMNVEYVIAHLVPEEVKTVEGINFYLKRFVADGHIVKEIRFNIDGDDFFFTEKVKALTLEDFQKYFEQANIDLLDIFGDYKLNKFDADTSQRLVMIFK
ncbi:class I SAM-dependent methyltransferase [Sungkyunkwania multivorans]|uniref:Class I SAM-dependent methyltransferase n=1 Tax=Sungkyunkwania multivorans TaxID=1173618 RepID=A0ABW3CU06_9FLAO